MTDNEIINAWKWHISSVHCNGMEIYSAVVECSRELAESTLNLIDRQKAEIERLSIESETLVTQLKVAYEQIHKLNMAKSEAIKEFEEKVDKLLKRYSHIHEDAEIARQDEIECDNETIEMQSVWDVHTLIRYEMGSEPEEMNRLQDNIETIAKERLLKEIEKDFRLFIKEMTEENKK